MTKYPAQIDTTSDLPTIVDNSTPIRAVTINRLRDTILAIEAELGVKPKGLSATVKARLDALDTTINGIDFKFIFDLSKISFYVYSHFFLIT